ncbi:hypothetical protein BKA64DRAFT_718303 [Cadophora sp. MPI-SDFR-AT-0126]|nr:hypothetical protein BKA64DRAFT_718303 [Leotiomycetes sp. MPI-SDFR-AT-0126]
MHCVANCNKTLGRSAEKIQERQKSPPDLTGLWVQAPGITSRNTHILDDVGTRCSQALTVTLLPQSQKSEAKWALAMPDPGTMGQGLAAPGLQFMAPPMFVFPLPESLLRLAELNYKFTGINPSKGKKWGFDLRSHTGDILVWNRQFKGRPTGVLSVLSVCPGPACFSQNCTGHDTIAIKKQIINVQSWPFTDHPARPQKWLPCPPHPAVFPATSFRACVPELALIGPLHVIRKHRKSVDALPADSAQFARCMA